MKSYIFAIVLILNAFLVSSSTFATPGNLEEHISQSDDPYLTSVQPILNNKCVACHSCMSAPCQLDMTSYEGLLRGASKINVYDFPEFKANAPTRIGIDARTPEEWTKKGFWSVTHRRNEKSILDMVLSPVDPAIYKDHMFLPDEGRACVSLEDDLRFFHKSPRGHMPYGFPNLSEPERDVITKWIDNGTLPPNEKSQLSLRESFHKDGKKILTSWENYFNEKSFKSRLRSRYIYEHLAFAMLTIDEMSGEHYRLVRASNEQGEPLEIATVRPFDKAADNFYYRLKKNIRTVMDKTNLPYHLSPKKMERWKELFDKPDLLAGPDTFPQYGDKGSNAFHTFKRIHPRNRYNFMLDDAYYHIMAFIKGPVCRGATALSVINDQFWVVFRDPSDKSLDDPALQLVFEKKMYPPASMESKLEKFDTFKENFWGSLKSKYKTYQDQKLVMSYDQIWDGGKEHNPSALLTVFRHNDSAQVLKGAIGGFPKTAWVLDYHVFEDIYYNLVAGYDVFGPYIHQVNTRLYMEISRISSEDLFLTMIDPTKREAIRSTWNMEVPKNKKSRAQKAAEYYAGSVSYKMKFKYPFLGSELKSGEKTASVEAAMKDLFQKKFNHRNFVTDDPINRSDKSEISQVGGPARFFPDVTMMMLKGKFYTLVRNKFHYNVSMLFFESNRLESSNDSLNLIPGVAASYPNLYVVADKDEKEIQTLIAGIKTKKDYESFLKLYAVSRHDNEFWPKNESFNQEAMKLLGSEGGRFDLSRYGQY